MKSEQFYHCAFLIGALLTCNMTVMGLNGDSFSQLWCQDLCHCVKPERSIMCFHQDRLTQIPTQFPMEYRKLAIQSPIFTSNVLTAANLTGLREFVSLKIIYSKLTRVASYTFMYLSALETLDLSTNQLQVLEPFAFSGLTLKSLNLQDNPGLTLQVDSFRGLKAKEISLRNNKLKQLQVETFYGLGLERLLLFNNLVEDLDPRFEEIFYNANSLLDLSQNPLHCSCNMIWLSRYMRLVMYQSNPRDVNVTCHSPRSLFNKPIHNLLVRDFDCPELAIREIVIDLKRSSSSPESKLECRASGNRPVMTSLDAKSSDHPVQLFPNLDSAKVQNNNAPSSSEISLDKVTKNFILSNPSTAYSCRAWTLSNTTPETSQTAEVLIDIRIPSEWLQSNITVTPDAAYREEEDVHFLLKGRFTMMELILAVIGTCLFTLLLTFLLSWSRPFLHAWKEHLSKEKDIKPPEPSESQHLQRLGGVQVPVKNCWSGHGSIHSSFMEGSQHDVYDVPQSPNTTMVPQMMTSTSNPMENPGVMSYYYPYHFLDFKTQQRLPRDVLS